MSDAELFDVVVYDVSTGTVVVVAGEKMRRSEGFYNAEKRLDTVLSYANLNDRHTARIVPSGRYKKGDVLAPTVAP